MVRQQRCTKEEIYFTKTCVLALLFEGALNRYLCVECEGGMTIYHVLNRYLCRRWGQLCWILGFEKSINWQCYYKIC